MRDFQGKTVAVTGAASGIGRATAEAFAEAGAGLALADIDGAGLKAAAAALERRGVRVEAHRCDVSLAADVERFRDAACSAFGRVDVLVNNAGIAVNGFVEDMTLADWERLLAVDLWGVIHGCHFFYPRMIAQGGGHLVNVASMAGLGPLPASAAYCAAKSGVVGLSEALRIDAARHGVGVSTICPGVVATGMGKSLRMVTGARGLDARETGRAIGRLMDRRGSPSADVAQAILRSVRRGGGLATVGPEALAVDLFRRASRGAYDAVMRRALGLILGRG